MNRSFDKLVWALIIVPFAGVIFFIGMLCGVAWYDREIAPILREKLIKCDVPAESPE
jgi:hypothetical protein